MNKEFSDKEEFNAEIRNKLTMPLTVLNEFKNGKSLPPEEIKLAIKELRDLLKLIEE